MALVLAFGFALGVLLTVLAGEHERKKRARRPAFLGTEIVGRGNWTAGYLCDENGAPRTLTVVPVFQDSTLSKRSH